MIVEFGKEFGLGFLLCFIGGEGWGFEYSRGICGLIF